MANQPTGLNANTEKGVLSISWRDHPSWDYPFKYLRENCGCAHCVHEITGERLLDPSQIPADIHIQTMSLVGNYAVKITWSDQHDTGLYAWTFLRELCRCSKCEDE